MQRVNHRPSESAPAAVGFRPDSGVGLVTGKRGAVRTNNSRLPVDNSGLGLGVGPTAPPTTGRKPEACPPSFFSLSQSKSCPEVQEPGGFLGPRSEAERPTLFNPKQINRNKELGRGRAWATKLPRCGALLLVEKRISE